MKIGSGPHSLPLKEWLPDENRYQRPENDFHWGIVSRPDEFFLVGHDFHWEIV